MERNPIRGNMKKLLFVLSLLLITSVSYATPTTQISVPNSFQPNTTASSSSVNANFNEVSSKFNSHTHTDITQVSTITSGTWNGTTISIPYGGTGLTTTTQGDILYADSANSLTKLPKSASATRYLSNTGSSNNPAWAQVDLTNGVTGDLPVANGGLGSTHIAAVANGGTGKDLSATGRGYVLYFNGTGLINAVAPGTAGQFLQTNGSTADPTWASSGLKLLSTTTNTNTTTSSNITIASNKLYLVQLTARASVNNDDVFSLHFNADTTSGNHIDTSGTNRTGVGLTNASQTAIVGSEAAISTWFWIDTFTLDQTGAPTIHIYAKLYGGKSVFTNQASAYVFYIPEGYYVNAAPTYFVIKDNRSFETLTVRVYEYGQ